MVLVKHRFNLVILATLQIEAGPELLDFLEQYVFLSFYLLDFFRVESSKGALVLPFVFLPSQLLQLQLILSLHVLDLLAQLFSNLLDILLLVLIFVSLNPQIVDIFLKENDLILLLSNSLLIESTFLVKVVAPGLKFFNYVAEGSVLLQQFVKLQGHVVDLLVFAFIKEEFHGAFLFIDCCQQVVLQSLDLLLEPLISFLHVFILLVHLSALSLICLVHDYLVFAELFHLLEALPVEAVSYTKYLMGLFAYDLQIPIDDIPPQFVDLYFQFQLLLFRGVVYLWKFDTLVCFSIFKGLVLHLLGVAVDVFFLGFVFLDTIVVESINYTVLDVAFFVFDDLRILLGLLDTFQLLLQL